MSLRTKGTLSTPAARDFAYSGIEHEDEVYSVRQLAARDSGAELKSERSLPTLVPTSGSGSKKGPIVKDEEISAKESITADDDSKSDDRPLAVTASIFRSANGAKDDLRKDSDLPRPLQEEKAFVQALKDSLEESIKESVKENNEPVAAERQDCRPAFVRTPFIFQVRSILTV